MGPQRKHKVFRITEKEYRDCLAWVHFEFAKNAMSESSKDIIVTVLNKVRPLPEPQEQES